MAMIGLQWIFVLVIVAQAQGQGADFDFVVDAGAPVPATPPVKLALIPRFTFSRNTNSMFFLSNTKSAAQKAGKRIRGSCGPGGVIQPNDPQYCHVYAPGGALQVCPTNYQFDTVRRCSLIPTCPEGYELIKGTSYCSEVGCGPNAEDVEGKCMEKCSTGFKRYYNSLCISEQTCPNEMNTLNTTKQCQLAKCPRSMTTTDDKCEGSCPPGFSVQGSMCVGIGKTKCPLNYDEGQGGFCNVKQCYEGEIMIENRFCVSDDYLECLPGYKASSMGYMCEMCKKYSTSNECLDLHKMCPRGWYLLNPDRCVQACPPETGALGGKCQSLSKDRCSTGFLKFGSSCVKGTQCPAGYSRVDNICEKIPEAGCSTVTLNGKCLSECPPGFVQHKQECIEQISGKCPPGFLSLAGKYCVKSCPDNHIEIGGGCHPMPSCEGKYSYYGKCYDTCPIGSTTNEESKYCFADGPRCRDRVMAWDARFSMHGCPSKEECEKSNGVVDKEFNICSTQKCGNKYHFEQFCLNECPFEYQALLKTCVKVTTSKCLSGVYSDGKCVDKCPAGQIPVEGVCRPFAPKTIVAECGVNMIKVECTNKTADCSPCVCKTDFVITNDKTHCVPKTVKCPKQHSLDVVILIDASEYISTAEFGLMKMYLLEAVTYLYTAKPHVRVAVIVFGSDKPEIVYLGTLKEECNCVSYLTQLSRQGGNSTTIIDALRLAREVVLSQCYGARLAVPRQVYVVTPARTYTPAITAYLAEEAIKQSDAGIRLAFMTVGKAKGLPENTYKIDVADFAQLTQQSDNLALIACDDFICPKGYENKGDTCVNKKVCDTNPCHKSALCLDTPGEHLCYCMIEGYEYVNELEGCVNTTQKCKDKVIEDKDICEAIKCKGIANCSASNGMGFCVCPRGYEYNKDAGCIDVDECKMNPCLHQGKCINRIGDFVCTCPPGYTYDIHFGCRDEDECVMNKNACSGNGKCTNTVGSYTCVCHAGYEYVKNVGCKDVDECRVLKPCKGDKVQCKNIPGSFECSCEPGYEYRDDGCKDVDECIKYGDKACGYGVLCINQVPGFNCTCHKGYIYEATSKTCKIDEDSGIQQKRADLLFAIDSGNPSTGLFDSIKEMVSNIIRDYQLKSEKIITRFSGLGFGDSNTLTVHFTKSEYDNAIKKTRDMSKLSGNPDIVAALKNAQNILRTDSQVNSTKLVFLIIGVNVTENPTERSAIKREIDQILSMGKLMILMVGDDLVRTGWIGIMKASEMEAMVIVVSMSAVMNIHKVIHEKTDTLITCPHGFIFLDNVCQYKTKTTKYCVWDEKYYAINSTWKDQCIQHLCTESGVQILDIKCLGHDQGCYKQKEKHPCMYKNEYYPLCQCWMKSSAKLSDIQGGSYNDLMEVFVVKEIGLPTTTESNGPCRLPFKYQNSWYYACTDSGSSKKWCYYEKNFNPNRPKWDYCVGEQRPCIVGGVTHDHGTNWEIECNYLSCEYGQLTITARCPGSDNKCYPQNDIFKCTVGDKSFDQCVCLVNSTGFGYIRTGGSYSYDLKNHTSEFVTYCEQGTTGKRHNMGEEWTQGCYRLKCDGGETKILDKQCQGSDKKCYPINSPPFSCTIRNVVQNQCSCEAQGDSVMLVARSKGETITETRSSGWSLTGSVMTASSKSAKAIGGTIV